MLQGEQRVGVEAQAAGVLCDRADETMRAMPTPDFDHDGELSHSAARLDDEPPER